MEYLNLLIEETYKILLLLIPVLVSVNDSLVRQESLGFCSKKKGP